MATRFVDIERVRLYEQLWTQPAVQLAQAYGVRPADIRCAALALAIPTPPSGHWTRVAFGKGVERPPLPEFAGATTYRVILRLDSEGEEVERRFRSERAQIAAPQSALPDLRSSVADCAAIVRKMHVRLRDRTTDKRGWPVVPAAYGLFALNVSPGNQLRALLAFDRVLRHCEAAGFRVNADETAVAPAVLTVSGLAFTLRIYESCTRKELELTEEQRAEAKVRPYLYRNRNRFAFHPTGILQLDVHLKENKLIGFSVQEQAGSQLADLIGDVPRRLQECVLRHRLHSDVRIEERKRSSEQRAAQVHDIKVKNAELDQLRRYEDMADKLTRARRLRDLASALVACGRLAGAEGQIELTWIHSAADWLDPTVGRPWTEVDDVNKAPLY